jgi:RNA polymerase sigma-70 factor (ECF subfamily)
VAEPIENVSPGDELVSRLRAGDERAFVELVRSMDGTLRRLARGVVGAVDLVDEIVQETWLGVVRGLASFEGRASLRTWICRILLNRARTAAVRAGRTVPFSALALEDELEAGGLPARFDDRGSWAVPPLPWEDERPEALLGRAELLAQVERVIQDLPDRQRLVILLREVEGWTAEEVCNALDLSETNQRVLLHRARGRIRAAIDPALAISESKP